MRRFFSSLLIILASVLAVSACNSGNAPAVTATQMHTLPAVHTTPSSGETSPVEVTGTVDATETAMPAVSPQAARNAGLPKPLYTLTVTLDYAAHRVDVEERIDYPNTGGDTLSDFLLLMDANRYSGVFFLKKLSKCGGEDIGIYSLNGVRLQFPLLEPLAPGEKLSLCLAYRLNLPPVSTNRNYSPNPFGYTYRQTNLVNWYPFIPPYRAGTGWVAHNPWYYGEYLVYPEADFDVTLHLKRAPEKTLVAASTLATSGEKPYRYHLEGGRNFVFSISHVYQRLEADVEGVKLYGFVFPADAKAGKAAFKATIGAFRLYSKIYGTYPHPGVAMVEADFDHGMEYQGLYFLSRAFFNLYDGSPKGYLTSIAAHETAHQWWFAEVANDQALEPWLDEALCTFSERLFYENVEPDGLNWWEKIRIAYYQPEGRVDTSIYDAGGYRPYVNAVYLNGAVFLQHLRELIGDDAFFAFLKDYYRENQGKIVSGDTFFALLKAHTSKNLDSLIADYFSSP